jgi:glycosyltransferase involved in cell wall biosynthesis
MLGLLYFGRLEKEKGFNDIIEMILLYEKNNYEVPSYFS